MIKDWSGLKTTSFNADFALNRKYAILPAFVLSKDY